MFSKSIQRATLAAGLAIAFLSLGSNPARAIVDGNPVTAIEQQDKGLVIISSPRGTCSGVLIVNDWVLTAGHCAIRNRLAPKNIQVALNGVRITVDAVYLFGGFADEVGPDLALMHLAAPFNINGSTSGFRNRIWAGAPRNLFGKTIASYGQGRNVCVGTTGSGTYRAADFVVESRAFATLSMPNDPANPPQSGSFVERTTGPFYQLLRNADGTNLRPGDSGGPSFIFENGTPFLVGIHSGGDCTDPPPGMSPAGSGDAYQTSLTSVRTWIEDVFKTQWFPGVQSQSIFVYQNEVNGTKWVVTNVNSIPWAQAARAAAAMCYNRGFAGGHFDGHQGSNTGGKGFGLQCSGGDTQWFDVQASQMDAQWRFAGDINAVNWAQAGRTAERFCATRGFAGGQFNGHQRSGRYGLFCYRGGAQWFDATDAELAATGWGFPTPRLDDNVWAQAGRAATGFCRGKGFTGGFMNGHQAPNRYGVVCQTDVIGQSTAQANDLRATRRVPGTRAPLKLSICEASRRARARNSPAAPGLEAQCRAAGAAGEVPPIDLAGLQAKGAQIADNDPEAGELRDQLNGAPARRGFEIGLAASEGQTLPGPGKQRIHDALSPAEQDGFTTAVNFTLSRNRNEIDDSGSRGEDIANEDPLARELRDEQRTREARSGFDIGMAAAEGQTAPGPGKQRIHDSLSGDKQLGFDAAVSFSLDRNRNSDLARTGAEIAGEDRPTARARRSEPDAMHRLGFDIATAIFGDPELGAKGNTARGPGSRKIRDGLSAAAQEGFDSSTAFHLSRDYRD